MIDLCMNRRGVLAGLAPLAAGIVGTGGAVQAANAPRLRISGNRLLLGDEPVRLRGVVVGDLLKAGRPLLFSYPAIARTWGANAVRIGIHPGYWTADTPWARRILADNVRAARAVGLFVILCWHALGFPDGFTFRPPLTWGMRADAFDKSVEKCRDFWSEMAELYGHDGGVVFELFNEPIHNPKDSAWNIGSGPSCARCGPISSALPSGRGRTMSSSAPAIAIAMTFAGLPRRRYIAYAWHLYQRLEAVMNLRRLRRPVSS